MKSIEEMTREQEAIQSQLSIEPPAVESSAEEAAQNPQTPLALAQRSI
jgi:hypothetical protein